MKTFLAIAIILQCFTLHAQSIVIKSSLNSSIETKGNLTLDGNQIELINVNLTCNSLIIKNSVNIIKTSGIVKIDCKNFVLEKDGHDIKIEKSTGLFSIEYVEDFVENNRNFVVDNDGDLKMRFSKKGSKQR